MNVAIIGGGAAGFFAAVNLKRMAPLVNVTIFEKQTDVMKKVLISGGGRCNLTNSFEEVTDLKQVYPRGHKLLKGLFKTFGPQDVYQWFEEQGVKLVTQEDCCVFPQAQDAAVVAGCLKRLANRYGVEIKTSHFVEDIRPEEGHYKITFKQEHNPARLFDSVVVTVGGQPRHEQMHYLERLGHHIETPVPSLFTFNITDSSLRELMGTVVTPAIAAIPGTKFKNTGAVLITHWGLSGPAILKLSSHAARYVHEQSYRFPLLINWVNENNSEHIMNYLQDIVKENLQKQIAKIHPFGLPSRLWLYLLQKAGIPHDRKWNELGRKGLNKLADTLCNDRYDVEGKGVFREEFVTCGGISTDSIHRQSLESKTCPGIYFAGEVLDIDGVTGGFNFQAAWTTAYTVAQAIAQSISVK